ncbi:MAG: OmpH family outer membrane protein [Bacteroidota bacterium]|nr:OmpH family outer membrane protein [Bacteroidota bacterium]
MSKYLNKSVFVLFFFIGFSVYSQKIGYIDTEFILSKIKEYKAAEDEIDKLANKYQVEIQEKYAEVEKMRSDYKSEEILLTEEMKKERQDTILAKDKRVREYQRKVFGYEGLIFLKRQELIKPIQEKVYVAVEKVSKKKQIQIMFDKSSELIMVYTDPKHDYTDYVLDELGLGDKKDTIDNKRKSDYVKGDTSGDTGGGGTNSNSNSNNNSPTNK